MLNSDLNEIQPVKKLPLMPQVFWCFYLLRDNVIIRFYLGSKNELKLSAKI